MFEGIKEPPSKRARTTPKISLPVPTALQTDERWWDLADKESSLVPPPSMILQTSESGSATEKEDFSVEPTEEVEKPLSAAKTSRKEKKKAYFKSYYKEHKEEIKAQVARYRKEHRETLNAKQRERYAKKMQQQQLGQSGAGSLGSAPVGELGIVPVASSIATPPPMVLPTNEELWRLTANSVAPTTALQTSGAGIETEDAAASGVAQPMGLPEDGAGLWGSGEELDPAGEPWIDLSAGGWDPSQIILPEDGAGLWGAGEELDPAGEDGIDIAASSIAPPPPMVLPTNEELWRLTANSVAPTTALQTSESGSETEKEDFSVEPTEEVEKPLSAAKTSRKEKKKVYSKSYYKEHKEEIKARVARYHKEHKEEVKARAARYRKEHKEEIKAWAARYRKEHKEEVKAQAARYRKEHKEESTAYFKKYHKEHRETLNAKRMERYAKKMQQQQLGQTANGVVLPQPPARPNRVAIAFSLNPSDE